MTVREDYTMTFTREHLDLLGQVDRTKGSSSNAVNRRTKPNLVLGAILRYPNDRATWFAVHPGSGFDPTNDPVT